MKKIIIIAVVGLFMVSCGKKYTYECRTEVYGQSGGYDNVTEKTCTKNAIERYIKHNTVDKDGVDYIISEGEQLTTCVQK
jgi:hypothetical protein